MPGFVIGGEGANEKFGGPQGNLEIRRTHRWVFESMQPFNNNDVMLVLKSASRPSVAFDEVEMDHNQEKVYLAGRHTWEPITLTWYDVEQQPNVSEEVYKWLNRRQNGGGGPFNELETMRISKPSDFKKDAVLKMINGSGASTESWKLYQCWPQSVNWNSLDYSSSDLQLIEVTLRFDRAVRG